MTAGLFAGAARVSIAPRSEDLHEGVYLGGFGAYRQRRATGVHDEPYCRALAISDGASTFVLASLDLVGASGPLLEAIRDDASRLTGLPAEHILIACTHSHASPDLQGLWGGTGAAYRAYVAHRTAAAVSEAHQALTTCSAAAVTTALSGLTCNRRGWPETDDTLTIVRFADAASAPIATLVNFACHPTASGATNVEVSRDWCGYAVDAVERETGGVAIYMNGAIGDVNPAAVGGFDAARALGQAVAGAAVEALDSAQPIGGRVTVRTQQIEIPMNVERLSKRVHGAIGRAGFALPALAKTGGLLVAAAALHAAGRADLAQIAAALHGMMERRIVQRELRTYILTHCGHVAIGDDLEALVAPGEVLTRLALPLRASMGSRHRLFFGLTHDTIGYFVPEDEWMTGRNGNYEESVSYGRQAGGVLADALLSMVLHHRDRA